MTQPIPLAYLITFTCYGTRLHGNAYGSVDREHNTYGTPFLPPDKARLLAEEKSLMQAPYELDCRRRELVLAAVREICSHRRWSLWAAHVRSAHIHLVVSAPVGPERIMRDIKAHASRALDGKSLDRGGRRRRWTQHGSTRYLWKPEQVGAAIHYVVREQGEAMAVWESPGGLM